MNRWNNKIAVVTGASSGIGAACCKALVAQGMIVVGLARRYERMENELKAELPKDQQNRFYAHKCDVGKEEDIIESFKWIEDTLGGIDVLINNAGITRRKQIVSANNTSDLKDSINVNILGVAFCTRQAFVSMKRKGIDGHIVIINSAVGHKIPHIQGVSLGIYPCSKYAITAMTEVLRQEFLLNQTKIKITSISPGAVDTEIMSEYVKAAMPILHPDDIADAVIYCLQTPPHVQIHELTIKPIGERF